MKKYSCSEKLKKRFGWVHLVIIVLAFAAIVGYQTVQANSVDEDNEGMKVENTYLLSVTTGASDGDNVLYFAVRYIDVDGINRTKYLIKNEDMARGFDLAAEAGTPEEEMKVTESLGYTPAGWVSQKPLQPYTCNTFLMETQFPVDKILGVDAFVRGQDSWTCQGLRLYKVDTLYGVNNYGCVSDQYYVEFAGELIGELTGVYGYMNFNWDVDRLFKMQGDGGNYTMKTEFTKEEAAYDSREQTEYGFKLDLADVYGAGIEAFANEISDNKAPLSGMALPEAVAVTLRYTDTAEDVREAVLPLMSNTLTWAISQGVSAESAISGFAQQGESLVFSCALPDFEKLEYCSITYNPSMVPGLTGMTYTGGSARHAQRIAAMNADKEAGARDSMSVGGITLYDMSRTEITPELKGARLAFNVTGDPEQYYKAGSIAGISIQPMAADRFTLEDYTEDAELSTRDYSNSYLIAIDTADIPSAATSSELTLRLNYVSLTGQQETSSAYVLQNSAKDYYGYWPMSGGVNAAQMAYLAGVASGGEMQVIINLNNVDYFTGASLSMDTGKNDDWQMSALQIYRVQSLSEREVDWEELTLGSGYSDRRYTRAFEGELIINFTQEMLMQSGDTKDMSFTSQEAVQKEDVDWSQIRYSMSYEDSTKNLGFTKVREKYTVNVEVGNDAVLNNGDGDCGSMNQFYFQLVFENGTSGCVLANQQLSADGFRAGYEETFSISTNQDYGEVTAVRIIPDDTSGNSDINDKLKIDSIRVSRASNGGLNRQWVIEQVGWIGIDYRDEGAVTSVSGQKGRTMEEIARVFPVSYSAYSVNLLFCLSTTLSDNGIQFQGQVTANLNYFNGAGELKTMTFDVVKAMADYANKTAIYSNGLDANGNVASLSNALSDPNYMFRENHTDRFVVSVDDVAELHSITFKCMGAVVSYWNISSVSASLITSDGSDLLLNANDEYVRSNETQPLCTHTSTYAPAYSVFTPLDTWEEANICFTENAIQVEDESTGWASAISREPLSQNDSLNIYVYMADDAENPSGYDMDAAIQYTNVYGGMYQTAVKSMNRGSGGRMFYATGVGAPSMAALNSLTLKTDTLSGPFASVDHAVIRQVRSGVIIATYEIQFGGANADLTCTASPSASLSQTGQQVVKLAFGSSTEAFALQAENRDIAVAIRYTTDNSGAEAREYTSPYIYLTDQEIGEIAAGQVAELTFAQPYVKDITGLAIVATGGLQATIESACVSTYGLESETGVRDFTGYAGFANGAALSKSVHVLLPTSGNVNSGTGTVVPLILKFTTTGASSSDTPVKMVIGYSDNNGKNREQTVNNIQNCFTTSGGLETGSTAEMKLLVENLGTLRWLKIEPYGAGGSDTAVWTIGSMSASMEKNGQQSMVSREMGVTITAGTGYTLNLSDITLTAEAKTYSSSNGAYTIRNTINGSCDILAESGRSVVITPKISGSLEGYTVKAERVADNGASADADSFLVKSGNGVTFTPPDNYGSSLIVYRVTMISDEIPSLTAVVNITVEPEEPPVENNGNNE